MQDISRTLSTETATNQIEKSLPAKPQRAQPATAAHGNQMTQSAASQSDGQTKPTGQMGGAAGLIFTDWASI